MDTTADERIAHVSGWTRTDGDMVHHVALCILAAYSRTGILAFILQAGLVARTFRIQNAFGTTGFVRIADVLGQASALATIAYGVWTARGQSTRIRGRCYCN